MGAARVPQGFRGSNHHPGRLVVHRTYRFSQGRWQSNEEHPKEQIVVRADAMWKGLFEFTHENARLEALHVQWETKQLKVGLPFLLPTCPNKTTLRLSNG
jgi:hypothetical protein